jgi:hypothetical protein
MAMITIPCSLIFFGLTATLICFTSQKGEPAPQWYYSFEECYSPKWLAPAPPAFGFLGVRPSSRLVSDEDLADYALQFRDVIDRIRA